MTAEDLVFADQLEPGERWPIGRYLMEEREMVDFSRAWDPQPMHVDVEGAGRNHYGGVIASGVHTFAVYVRLAVDSVYSRWAVVAGRTVRDLEYPRPVRPGMTLTGSVLVEAVEPRGGGRSLVRHSGILADDDGDPVFTVAVEAYVFRSARARAAHREGRQQ